MRYCIGADFGGGAAKATLLREDGEVIAAVQKEYPMYFPEKGWAEHDPVEHYEVFCHIIRELLSVSGVDREAVCALAISAGSQTGAYLDENDIPVRRAIYWSDNRAVEHADWLWENHRDSVYSKCHNVAAPSRTLTHLMWMRVREAENFARIRRVMFMKDYIRYRLTGDFVTDYIDAMGSLLMDVPNNRWSEELCSYAGISPATLPEILSPGDMVGPLTAKAVEDTGLSPKTKIIVGSTDTVMEVYANGAITPGSATVKLATAGRICVITDRPLDNPMLINYKHVIPGLWYPGSGTKTCAASFRWYRDVFCEKEMEEATREGLDAYRLMDRLAESVEPLSGGLFFHPYLQGENTPYYDSSLSASFVGARSYHGKAHFTRALLEGVAFSMKDCLVELRRANVNIEKATVIGGGAKSPLWRRILCDALGIELVKTVNSDSSLGTAMLAGVGVGMFASFEDSVDRCVKIDRSVRLTPDPAAAALYDEGFAVYKQIHDALAPIYQKTSGAPAK